MRNLEKLLSAAALKLYKGFVVEKDLEPSEIDHTSIKNILIVVRHQMGDMLCAVPMMRSVRDFYPAAHITLLTKRSTSFEEIFSNNNSPVNEVINYEHGFEQMLDISKTLKDKNIDLAVIPSSVNFSVTNHLIPHLSHARYRVGVRSKDYEPNPVAYLLNIKNDFLWDSKKVHQSERNLDVIKQAGIKPAGNTLRLTLREENKKFAEDFIAANFPGGSQPIIGFHPGAGKHGNVWPAENFAELACMLRQKTGARIFISEGPMDSKYVNELEGLLRQKYNIADFAKHKGELMNNTAIISMLDLFITNDTGVMHLASGFDVPVIAVFGPTKACEWGPLGKNKVSLQALGDNINNAETGVILETALGYLGVKIDNNSQI